jgi:hypothetical protein
MTIQTNVLTRVARKKEATFGQLPGASGAREFRRISDSIALKKNKIQSNAIQSNAQRPMARTRRPDRRRLGELRICPGLDRGSAGVDRAPRLDGRDTADRPDHHRVGLGAELRALGRLTDGLAVGMLVKFAGFTSGATANNGKLYTIIGLTATDLNVAEVVAPAASAASIGLTVPGKITYIPETGHTNDSYTIEKWYSAVSESLRFTGQRVARSSSA